MKKCVTFVALIAASLSPSLALAATASSSMTVSTTVVQSCKVVAVTNLNFGQYLPATTNATQNRDTTNTVQVSCVAGSTGVSIALDQGQNATSSSTCASPQRRMSSTAGDFLSYAIYSDASRTLPYGCSAGVNTKDFAANAFTSTDAVTVTQYGRIPAGQDPKKDSYTDTVGVTVTF